MAITIDQALDDPLITIIERDDNSGYFRVTLGTLKTAIDICLSFRSDEGRWFFAQGHAIKTPDQDAPYLTSCPWNDYPTAALQQAIEGLTWYYKWAVAEGMAPDKSWLVPRDASPALPAS